MTPLPAPGLLAALRWRYATKAFDPVRVIPEELWDALEETLVLTPSSFGLQPWHFVVLTDRALRERLVPHSWGQRQVAECSHFVVMCIHRGVGTAEIDALLARTSEVRGTPPAQLAGFRKMMVGSLVEGPGAAAINEWATRQAYIALGNFMTAAAVLGVDTCPMEGFEPARFDEILGLPERNLTSTVCCAAGYRSPSDKYAVLPKVRFPRAQVIERR
ncbi:MAG: NAD(P)H-dependent oxidoreductase [Limisphaerales bacterium]